MSTTQKIDRLIIIDQELMLNDNFIASLEENFNIKIEYEENLEFLDQYAQNILYISSSFEGPSFEKLMSQRKPIISDIIVENSIANREALPQPKYPLFNYFMKDFIICFSIDDKKQTYLINKYLNLIRFMGGQSRRDMKSGKSYERTHLIDSKTESSNYKLATIYEIPILYKEWIDYLWQFRRVKDFVPNDEAHLSKFRIKPLSDLKITLFNYTPEEVAEKSNSIAQFGGTVVPLYDENCSHFVVGNATDLSYLEILNNYSKAPRYVVSNKWLDAVFASNYHELEENYLLQTPSFEKANLAENTPVREDHTLNSLLLSPNYDNSIDDSSIADKNDLKKQAITQELYQTELNYVTILKNIIKIFRDPLKNHQLHGQFPNEIEIKTMFGGLPPIIEVHEKILLELELVVKNWKVENEVGKIFQKHSQKFLTVYPQYVNYYEQTKETIENCINKYPKFNSFLKACQTSSECRKQTFQELLINPIQRLPRIELYLRSIFSNFGQIVLIFVSALLERTDKLHPDYKLLNEALNTIVSVNKEINFEKKKIEGQIEMFDLLNDIEDCPATLLSAHRHFVSKCDARLLIQNSFNEGDSTKIFKLDNYVFCLLLFTDQILICKKRTVKRANSLRDRTPNIPPSLTKKSKKTYKYIETIELSSIKCIYYDFEEHDISIDSSSSFAIVTGLESNKRYFTTYTFVVKDQQIKKDKFVENIVSAYEKIFSNVESNFLKKGSLKNLDFSHSKTIARFLNKSKYVFLRTKERLNRTFSMRRTASNLTLSLENLNSSSFFGSPSRSSRVFTDA